MARNTSVSLGEHFTKFIEEQVASGRYATASDVIRDGLRRLEDEAEELAWLRLQIQEAKAEYAAGRYREVTPDFWDELNREVAGSATHDDQRASHVRS